MTHPPRIVVANHKGGCGKTSLVFNLAGAYAAEGRRVLIIDLDPQGNLSQSLTHTGAHTVADIFTGSECLPRQTNIERIDIIAANMSLSHVALAVLSDVDLQFKLRDYLAGVEGYDLILIDTPPTLTGFSLAGLLAADHVLIPINTSYYTMSGTNDLLAGINRIKNRLHPELCMLGACVSMHDGRTALANEVLGRVREQFGERFIEPDISRTVKVEESQVKRTPVVQLFPSSIIAGEYAALAEEIERRVSHE